MEILKAIIQYLPLVISIVLTFVYFKANKRIKNNEADNGEIKNLREIIEEVRKEKDSLKKRVEVLEKNEVVHRQEILKKEMMIVDYEGLLIKLKRAINFGGECDKHPESCPIMKKFNEIKTDIL